MEQALRAQWTSALAPTGQHLGNEAVGPTRGPGYVRGTTRRGGHRAAAAPASRRRQSAPAGPGRAEPPSRRRARRGRRSCGPCPMSNTRARAANSAGTSSTRSPSASSRCATGRPTPLAPSTAQPTPGPATDGRPSTCRGSCRCRCRTCQSRAAPRGCRGPRSSPTACADPSRSPPGASPSSSPRSGWSCQRGRATLFRAEQTLLQPRLAAVPGRVARHERATPR
jgi:hypothetical protein